MFLKQALAAAVLATVAASPALAAIAETDAFTIEYDENTDFGFINFTSGSTGVRGFGWDKFPSNAVASAIGGTDSLSLGMPTLTITAKEGWSLAEFIRGLSGGFYSETGEGSTTSVTITGSIALDNGADEAFTTDATKNPLVDTPAFRLGNWEGNGQYNFSLAQKIVLSGLTFEFMADGTDGNAGIVGQQPGPRFDIGVVEAPIPEPETYALMALGLVAVGAAARRRKQK